MAFSLVLVLLFQRLLGRLLKKGGGLRPACLVFDQRLRRACSGFGQALGRSWRVFCFVGVSGYQRQSRCGGPVPRAAYKDRQAGRKWRRSLVALTSGPLLGKNRMHRAACAARAAFSSGGFGEICRELGRVAWTLRGPRHAKPCRDNVKTKEVHENMPSKKDLPPLVSV